MNIESLCDWENGTAVTIHREFWNAWRESKDELKAAGVRVRPGPEKTWIVTWAGAKTVAIKSSGPPPRTGGEQFEKAMITTVVAPPAEAVPTIITQDGINWTQEQLNIFEAVRTHKGHFIVRARAGSGKTTTIVKAMEYSTAESILYVVFNKKNAVEARRKIQDPRVEAMTFGSCGYRIVLRVWPKTQTTDDVEFDRIREVGGKDMPDAVVGAVFKLVTWAKNTTVGVADIEDLEEMADLKDFTTPEFESDQMGGWRINKLAMVAQGVMEISKHKDAQGRISWADQVWLPVAMNWVRPTYGDVFVDECQDMNAVQLEMARRLVKGRCCCIGDDRQAIYAFRGATSNGLDFMKMVLNATEFGLTVTQRNPRKVVDIAKQFVPDFKAADRAVDGQIDGIRESQLAANVKLGDVVLSRANAALTPLCLSVLRKGLRARIEGKDIGRALVGLVNNLKAGSVPQFIERVEGWREKSISRAQSRPRTAEEKCMMINDQADTLLALAEGMASVDEIRERITTLFENADDTSVPAVVFSTVHKAKGLEWDRVFIIRETFLRRKITEEENIYYVAVTRARKHLIFVNNEKPAETGGTQSN